MATGTQEVSHAPGDQIAVARARSQLEVLAERPHRVGDLSLFFVCQPEPAVAGGGRRRRPYGLLVGGDRGGRVATQEPLVPALVGGSCGPLILGVLWSNRSLERDHPLVLAATRMGRALPLMMCAMHGVRTRARVGVVGRRRRAGEARRLDGFIVVRGCRWRQG